MLISIVIPARNEEENIVPTVIELEKTLNDLPHETLVVNDHSTDRTSQKVQDLIRILPAVKLIDNTNNPGFASALWTGFQSARGDAVVVVMADACDDPTTIPGMVAEFQEGYDLVCGSRYITGGGKDSGPKLQGFFSFVINKFLHLFFRIPTTDASNAFKIYRREILLKMKPREKGFALSLELAVNFWKKGYKIVDVPTLWKSRIKGHSKFKFRRAFFSYGRQIIHLFYE
ncbi:MAG: glycosyltransferase family 2 protein [Candidatus Omnitrophota bacterium]